MKIKKKICKCCNTEQFIFSQGRCMPCSKRSYKPLSKVRKPTGERKVHHQIWLEREHQCEHCGDWLGDYPSPAFFAHRIRKSKSEELRLEVTNFSLMCFDCHFEMDQGTKEKFDKRKDLHRPKDV